MFVRDVFRARVLALNTTATPLMSGAAYEDEGR